MTSATEKSAQAFRTISEVSEELDVPQHVLRFWETRFPQVKPLKRGGNRRYYRPEDIDLLRAISHLHYVDGYTLKGVQKLLRDNGPKTLVADFMARDGTPPSAIDAPPSNSALQDAIEELKAIRTLIAGG